MRPLTYAYASADGDIAIETIADSDDKAMRRAIYLLTEGQIHPPPSWGRSRVMNEFKALAKKTDGYIAVVTVELAF